MKSIQADETEIIGKWVLVGGVVYADENCQRITFLIENDLDGLGCDSSGWEALYRDRLDGRLWELTHPSGDLHGGGPQSLTEISVEEAKRKYGIGDTL